MINEFDWILGLGIIGTIAGIIEMNEFLRFVILVATCIGIIIKTYEQIKNSPNFLKDVKTLWKKINKK